MSIILNWANFHGTVPDQIKIWRSDTKGGTFTLVDTIAGNLLTYTDTTAVNNKVYWYRIDTIVGTDTGQSLIIPYAYFPNTGPGPSTILRGDWEFGYFGEILVTAGTLPTSAQLTTATGVNYQNNSSLTSYYKWVINGKIIFIPNRFYVYGVAPYSGMGKMFSYPAGKDFATTGTIFSNNGNSYLIRAPFATNKFETTVNPNNEFGFTYVNGSVSAITSWDNSFNKSELAAIMNCYANISLKNKIICGRYNDASMVIPSLQYPLVTNTYVAAGGIIASFPLGGTITGQDNEIVYQGITILSTLHPVLVLQL